MGQVVAEAELKGAIEASSQSAERAAPRRLHHACCCARSAPSQQHHPTTPLLVAPPSLPRPQCAANPVPILLGFVCQYSILPLLAVAISKIMNLPAAFATGLILLGCCPGEQAVQLLGLGCLRPAQQLASSRPRGRSRQHRWPLCCPSAGQNPLERWHAADTQWLPFTRAGGQASNVATYVAHGDVALSVLMTAGAPHALFKHMSTCCR